MLRFIKSLQFVFKPTYWLKQSPYCRILDKNINNLLDRGVKFTNIRQYTADLGDLKEIWICRGDPFSYGQLWPQCNYQPSRLTIQRMKRAMLKQIESEL
jgi:hypothetical protein